MKIIIEKNSELLGVKAAALISEKINNAIEEKGNARILVSTGASQLTTFESLLKMEVDWKCVTLFNLDEYIGLPESHPASFVRYIKERFASKVPLRKVVLVEGICDIQEHINYLTEELRQEPIDVGVIGIGVNGHIAFNDPPADFETKEAYRVVTLDNVRRMQQVGEGWFSSIEETPPQAISMTPYQIMQCESIVSPVPYAVKAQAVYSLMTASSVDPNIPCTLLKTHPDVTLILDEESASKCDPAMFNTGKG